MAKINLFKDQKFIPFGTDSVGVITSVSAANVEFFYEHDRETRHTVEKRSLIKFARILPRESIKLVQK